MPMFCPKPVTFYNMFNDQHYATICLMTNIPRPVRVAQSFMLAHLGIFTKNVLKHSLVLL